MKLLIPILVTLILSAQPLAAQLKSPDEFLPHRLGEQFTPHHLLVDYVEHVAANSPNNVKLMQYGATWEQRPLMLAIISSPENMARLEAIRTNNLRRAGLLEGSTDPALDGIAIVWLSYSVHGNEAAGSEASMGVLYDLANPQNTRTQAWLRNTVVLLDPSINPDGYSRYTSWYRGISNRLPDPKPESWEHREPWPGGRVNHYLFDLNRDWAWQTQIESRQRAVVYYQWLPQIHADLHEQGYNSPYYFAPAAKPYHAYITPWQRQFQVEIGRNHARYFDENGWFYFTRERFDLLYPSYGDTYPTYNGAIGMTYEQGGIGAGRAVLLENGDTLTLSDRVAHHRSTSLSTVEIASRQAAELTRNFADFFNKARNNPPGPYKTYIVKGDNPAGHLRALTELLDRNHIAYGKARQSATIKAFNYVSGKEETVRVETNDLLISAHQPQGVLAQILFDPETTLEDSATYDITAWSLPYAYGLRSFASRERLNVQPGFEMPSAAAAEAARQVYAFLLPWTGLDNARFLADLLQQGVVVRFASEPFTLQGKRYQPGTLMIARADNPLAGNGFAGLIRTKALAHGQLLQEVSSGFADEGRDLGSNAFRVINRPRIAILSGEGTFSNSFGQSWYFFEQDLRYPVSIFPANGLSRLPLDAYNLIVMTEGSYSIDESTARKLGDWVSAGGRLIVVGDANNLVANKAGFQLKNKEGGPDQGKAPDANNVQPSDYAGQERQYLSSAIPGAIFKVDLDTGHPLAYGLPEYYFSLKTGESAFAPLSEGWNVGTIGSELQVSGFAGVKAREQVRNSLVFGVQDRGRGCVVYLVDNPLFRSFWHNGKFLFSNAVFFAGQ